MQLKEFTKQYQLHLLPVSHASVQLGDLVQKGWLGGYRIKRSGTGSNIFNRFYDAELLSQPDWTALLSELQTPPCQVAALAQLHLRNFEKVSGLFLQSLGAEWTEKKIMSMRIKSVCARVLPDPLRMKVDGMLEQLNAKQFRELIGPPGRVHLITELYYGALKLFIEKKFDAELQSSAQKNNVALTLVNEGEFINEYDFENTAVPFAYRLEKLKRFKG